MPNRLSASTRGDRSIISGRAIRDHPEAVPPEFDHDGIEDGHITEMGSMLYYRDEEWTEQ